MGLFSDKEDNTKTAEKPKEQEALNQGASSKTHPGQTKDASQELEIKKTTKYGQFRFMRANRGVSEPHVQDLVKSFEEHPELVTTKVVLVNEDMEVIDGQHSVQACEFLKIPVYYRIIKKGDIKAAQVLNALQKGWRLYDFARSYALTGNKNYVEFLKLYEEYPIPITVLVSYCTSREGKGLMKDFKQGKLEITDDKEEILERLEKLVDTSKYVSFWKDYNYSLMMLQVFRHPRYDHKLYLKKLKANPLKSAGSKEDMIRNIEEHYNRNLSDEKRLRLF